MKFVLGVDPGKKGGFVLLSPDGQIISTALMDYDGSTLSASATAKTYERFLGIVHEIGRDTDQEVEMEVFIEKAFTKPTDAVQESYIANLEAVCREVVYRADNLGNELVRANEAFAPVMEKIEEARADAKAGGGRGRVDGRVGTFNYAKSCGVLEICAAFDIPYHLVHPKTWCAVMHKGADMKLKAKDKSKQIIGRRWALYAQKGSELWVGERARSMHEGLMDAFLIAQYGLTL